MCIKTAVTQSAAQRQNYTHDICDSDNKKSHLVFIQECSDAGVSFSHKSALIQQLSCGSKGAEVNVYLLAALAFKGGDSFLEEVCVLWKA